MVTAERCTFQHDNNRKHTAMILDRIVDQSLPTSATTMGIFLQARLEQILSLRSANLISLIPLQRCRTSEGPTLDNSPSSF